MFCIGILHLIQGGGVDRGDDQTADRDGGHEGEAQLGGDAAAEAAQPGAGAEGKHPGLLPGAAAPGRRDGGQRGRDQAHSV